MLNHRDTIIALATPPGEGSIAIIRLSGNESLKLLQEYFKASSRQYNFESHRLCHGFIINSNGAAIDEVMAVYMASPRTYTYEDIVEIHCHGSRQIVRSLIHLFCQSGVRLARPGEFTYRAFLNGRIDLTQAEGVARLISSTTESSRKLALSQSQGLLAREIDKFSSVIKKNLVFLEAWIDFPEEDLPHEDLSTVYNQIREVLVDIKKITSTFHYGRILHEGVSVLLVGKPNVGKSSLLNYFLGEDRAIVTDIPGTTRDILEEGLVIGDLPVRLFDTAGLRDTLDPVEQEGVRRAKSKIDQADLVLLLVDSSYPLDEHDFLALDFCKDRHCIVVPTKTDLVASDKFSLQSDLPVCPVSTKTGEGIDSLTETILSFFSQSFQDSSDSVLISERRHFEALVKCQENLDNFLKLDFYQHSLEFLAFELHEALDHLGEISGKVSSESLLDDIFSNFCIGK